MVSVEFGCRTANSRRVRANGLSLHVLEWGRRGRPGLCFLHGGAAHAHWFDLVAPVFADRFHVISLDQRGHGESEWPRPAAYGTENFAADLEGVLNALGWRDVTLVGHSMGGHNAMSFASWHPPRVRALVIVDSRPAMPEERLGRMRRQGQRPMRRYPSREAAAESFRLIPPDTIAAPEFLRHLGEVGAVQRDGGWVRAFDPHTSASRRPTDAWRLVSNITAPTLIVRGELSPVLTPEMVERLHALIRKSSAVEIAGAYHHLTLDRPREFVDVLDAFLRSV